MDVGCVFRGQINWETERRNKRKTKGDNSVKEPRVIPKGLIENGRINKKGRKEWKNWERGSVWERSDHLR